MADCELKWDIPKKKEYDMQISVFFVCANCVL